MTRGTQRFLVVTAFDTNYEVGFLCSVVNEAYCQSKQYTFKRILLSPEDMQQLAGGRHLAWAKVALLLELVQGMDGAHRSMLGRRQLNVDSLDYDYIVWIDADAMILDHSVRLEYFVEVAGGADFIIGEDMADTDLLNTGLMFFRRASPWCQRILRRWWEESDERWHQEVCWDQTGLCRLLSQDGLDRLSCHPVAGERPGSPGPGWFSWARGTRYKRWEHLFVFDCGSFNFKYLNNCRFVFHAVGERELLLSFRPGLLLKKDRLELAVRGGFVVHGQDVVSLQLLEASLGLLAESEVRSAKVSLENALQSWRSFGLGKGGKKAEAPPLGWGLPASAWSDCRHLPSHIMIGPMKFESACPQSLSPSDLAQGDRVVRLLRPPKDSKSSQHESFTTRLWQLCSYMLGDLPPFSPLSSTQLPPWRLLREPGLINEGLAKWQCQALEAGPLVVVISRFSLVSSSSQQLESA
eukprot:Skav233358  [mRNA]  locus=scaffold394:560608:562005:+ [translate_table: standard]